MFITWDPAEKIETFTVQPKFEGNALDFGMVIPTPTQPKLNEMPRDFFKHLAIYTIMRKREFAHSKLLPLIEPQDDRRNMLGAFNFAPANGAAFKLGDKAEREERKPAIKILEVGTVGSLDYKIIEAGRADDLYKWLNSATQRCSLTRLTMSVEPGSIAESTTSG